MIPHKMSIAIIFVGSGLLACASMAREMAGHPVAGTGVDAELLETIPCDPDQFHADAERYRKTEQMYAVPRVGDDTCDVLAKLGLPSRQDAVETEWGQGFHWWYEERRPALGGYRHLTHLVVLGCEEDRCTVRAVNWTSG